MFWILKAKHNIILCGFSFYLHLFPHRLPCHAFCFLKNMTGMFTSQFVQQFNITIYFICFLCCGTSSYNWLTSHKTIKLKSILKIYIKYILSSSYCFRGHHIHNKCFSLQKLILLCILNNILRTCWHLKWARLNPRKIRHH